MTDEYTKIAWSDVQPGDILMHENGDRLTVRRVDGVWVSVPGSQHNRHYWEERGFTPHRPVPPLGAVPTEPGAYLDKDGNVCVLKDDDDAAPWISRDDFFRPVEMRHRAPFTRLVPMPTEADVLAEASRHFHVSSKRDQLEDWWLCDCGERFDILIEHQVEKIVALYKGEGGGS